MKRPDSDAGSASEWITHARSDLALAKLAAGDQNILASQAGFHAQQAAEKAMKAVLRSRNVSFPFTHDIDVLLDVCGEAGLQIPDAVQQAGRLSPYAVEARYPGSAKSSESDVQPSIQLAEKVLDWATSLLKDV